MAIPKRKPTKVPLLPSSGSLQDYVGALHPSLFTNPSYFTPSYTGITGDVGIAGVIIGTARAMFLAITISGATVAAAGTISVPLIKAAPTILSVTWTGPPSVEMQPATLDSEGIITLPPWDVYGGDILITGLVMEA